MAKPILIANWKNHPSSLAEARFLLKELGNKRLLYKKMMLFIAPPLPYLEAVADRTRGFAGLAVQDIFPAEKGRFTGSVTPDILKSFGVRLAIVGHSERRAMGESAADIVQKAKAALRNGIMPLICVGERLRDAEGEHFSYLEEDMKAILTNFSKKEASKLMIAYEPAWAIGKAGEDAIDPLDLSQAVIFIRKVLSDIFGRREAEGVPILYGGSVEPANAGELLRHTGIRGFLVGHASLKAKSFRDIADSLL